MATPLHAPLTLYGPIYRAEKSIAGSGSFHFLGLRFLVYLGIKAIAAKLLLLALDVCFCRALLLYRVKRALVLN